MHFTSDDVAYHEAGHAVACVVQGIEVVDCRFDPAKGNGVVNHVPCDRSAVEKPNDAYVQKYIVVCLAGWEAQLFYEPTLNPEAYKNSLEQDRNEARCLLDCIKASAQDREAIHLECKRRARSLIEENWKKVEKLACALLKRHCLSGDEIVALIASAEK